MHFLVRDPGQIYQLILTFPRPPNISHLGREIDSTKNVDAEFRVSDRRIETVAAYQRAESGWGFFSEVLEAESPGPRQRNGHPQKEKKIGKKKVASRPRPDLLYTVGPKIQSGGGKNKVGSRTDRSRQKKAAKADHLAAICFSARTCRHR